MKTLLLALILLVPVLVRADMPATSGEVTTATDTPIKAPRTFDLHNAIQALNKPAASGTVGAEALASAQAMNGTNAEILLAPMAAPEPSSMAFSACVIALVGVLLLRMRLTRDNSRPLDAKVDQSA